MFMRANTSSHFGLKKYANVTFDRYISRAPPHFHTSIQTYIYIKVNFYLDNDFSLLTTMKITVKVLTQKISKAVVLIIQKIEKTRYHHIPLLPLSAVMVAWCAAAKVFFLLFGKSVI